MGWRRSCAVFVLIGLCLGVLSPRAPAFGPFPAYVDDMGTWVLLSNAQWGTGTAHARELRAQPVVLSSPSEKSSLVWTPTCSNAAQVADFTRQANLPGRPATVSFNLEALTLTGASAVPVFKSVELLVNGHTALDVAGSSLIRPNLLELQVPPSANQWFRYGENTLTVRVTKGASRTSSPGCNRSSSTLLGVVFGLQGSSAADLSVLAGKGTQYVRGSAYQFNGVFTVRNTGPSAAIGGEFSFLAQIGFLQGVVDTSLRTIKATAPFGSCTATEGIVTGRLSVNCPFTLFPPGASATISFTTQVKIPPDEPPSEVFDMDVTWGIKSFVTGSTYGGTRDPNSANDTYDEQIYVCGPQATDPKCPGAPSG